MAPSSSHEPPDTGPAAVTSLPLAVFGVILVFLVCFAASIVYLRRQDSQPYEKRGQQFSIDVSVDVYTVLSEREDTKIEGIKCEDAIASLPLADTVTALKFCPSVQPPVLQESGKLSPINWTPATHRLSPDSLNGRYNNEPQTTSHSPLCSSGHCSHGMSTSPASSALDFTHAACSACTAIASPTPSASTTPSPAASPASRIALPANVRLRQPSYDPLLSRFHFGAQLKTPALRGLHLPGQAPLEDATLVSNASKQPAESSRADLLLLLPQVLDQHTDISHVTCLDDQDHSSEEDICVQVEIAGDSRNVWQGNQGVRSSFLSQESGQSPTQQRPESSRSLANAWLHSPLLATSSVPLQKNSSPSSPSSPWSLDLGTLRYPETSLFSVQLVDGDSFSLPAFYEEAFIDEVRPRLISVRMPDNFMRHCYCFSNRRYAHRAGTYQPACFLEVLPKPLSRKSTSATLLRPSESNWTLLYSRAY